MTRSRKTIATAGVGILGLALAATAPAATVDLGVLHVDQFSGTTVSPSIGSYSFTFSPTLNLAMGGYAGTLFDQTDSQGVTVSLDSTSAYGGAPLSGTANAITGTLNLDLSSLYATVSYPGTLSYSGSIWSPTSSIRQNAYDASTGAFTYGWENTSTATVNGIPTPVTYDITLHGSGTVSTVPVPAAVWLFGSGLLGLAGVGTEGRRRLPGQSPRLGWRW
ncbi:MAG: hypothetical protein P8124_08290 [Gammaproteobacteria bacterium]